MELLTVASEGTRTLVHERHRHGGRQAQKRVPLVENNDEEVIF
jgi:hypothetical protein